MKNNTKVRLRLSKQLFESLSKQIIAEAKANDGYTVAVKQPKMPKQSASQATSPEVQETDKEAMMEEGIGSKDFTYTDASGKTKFVTADNIDQAKEKVERYGGKADSVKEKSSANPIAPKMEEMSSKEKMAKGLYKETEKESAKKVMADITALSKENQDKIKKFIKSHSQN